MTNIIQFPKGLHTPDKPREMITESWVAPDDCAIEFIEASIQFKATHIWEDYKE